MRIRCPNCSTMGNLPGDSVRKKAHCPHCNTYFIVTEGLLDQGVERRKSRRVAATGIYCYFGFMLGGAEVADISKTGLRIGIPDADVDFKIGDTANITLHITKDFILEELPVEILRTKDGALGCRFLSISKETLSTLESLVHALAFSEKLDEADQVTLEMDEKTIELKAKGYL